MNTVIRTYTELMKLKTFEERFRYLKLVAQVGKETFGFDRYLNQEFYHSQEWKSIRNEVIVRDNACDLGIPGREMSKYILIHHMNPISKDDLIHQTDFYLILSILYVLARELTPLYIMVMKAYYLET